MLFAFIAVIILSFAIGMFMEFVLVVEPLRLENYTLLELLDQHIVPGNSGESRVRTVAELLEDRGAAMQHPSRRGVAGTDLSWMDKAPTDEAKSHLSLVDDLLGWDGVHEWSPMTNDAHDQAIKLANKGSESQPRHRR